MSVFNNLLRLDKTQPYIPQTPVGFPTTQLKSDESKTASFGAAQLSPTGQASSGIIRTNRPPASISTKVTPPLAEALKNQSPSQNAIYSFPSKDTLRTYASNQLNNKEQMAEGNQKLLGEMNKTPEQLEKDLKRSGDLKLGETTFPSETYGAKSPEVIYRWASTNISIYIASENPNLQVSKNKINEILYSGCAQTFANDLYDKGLKAEILPMPPEDWAPKSSKQMTTFEFEKTFLGLSDPTVLVVTKRIEKKFFNIEDSSQPDQNVILEAKVKHDLKTGIVTFENTITVNGKEHQII